MVALVIENTIGTLCNLMDLLARFMQCIGLVMGSGFGGFVLGFIILGLVLFFLAKFAFSSGKLLFLLAAAGVVILIVIYIGTAAYG